MIPLLVIIRLFIDECKLFGRAVLNLAYTELIHHHAKK